MKRKTTATDAKTGEKTSKVAEIRNLDHFEVQLRIRAHAFRDKKKYTCKIKRKSKDFD